MGTEKYHFDPHELYFGTDVGKSFHWAIVVDGQGSIVIDRPRRNRQQEIDALIAEAGESALVVVGQKNNIGQLVFGADNTLRQRLGNAPEISL